MNENGVTYLFLLVVIDIARRIKLAPSKLLMPLALASLLDGSNTLNSTPPNIFISEALKEAGLRPFRMYDYTPVGMNVLVTETTIKSLVGSRLLPNREPVGKLSSACIIDFKFLYELGDHMLPFNLPEVSLLDGKSMSESRLGAVLGLNVVAVIRNGSMQLSPGSTYTLQVGDRLLVEGRLEQLSELHSANHLVLEKEGFRVERLVSANIDLVEARLSPASSLIGQTLLQIGFHQSYSVVVLAIMREGVPFRTNLESIPLLGDDVLLIQGRREQLDDLSNDPDLTAISPTSLTDCQLEERFMVLQAPAESARVGKSLTESHVGDSSGLSVLGIIRAGETCLIPSPAEELQAEDRLLVKGKQSDLLMVEGLQNLEIETQPLPDLGELESKEIGLVEEVYHSINWKAVFLIAGMLPMGIAMEQTGAAQFLANGMVGLIGGLGPLAVMAGFFLLAAITSQFMPNPAVAVLLAPIALSTASDLGISPYPLMMTVAVSASAAFLSPVGHSANVLVMGLGGYRFSDYLKVGIPLTLIVLAVVLMIMPVFWPF